MCEKAKRQTGGKLGALDAKSADELDSLRTKVIWALLVVIGLIIYFFSK